MTGSAEMLLLAPLVLLPPVIIVAVLLYFAKRKETNVEAETANGSKSRGLPLMTQNGSSSATKSRSLALASSQSRSLPTAVDDFDGAIASGKRTKKNRKKKKIVGGAGASRASDEIVESRAMDVAVSPAESNDTTKENGVAVAAGTKAVPKKRKKKRGGVKHKKASDDLDDKSEDDAKVKTRGGLELLEENAEEGEKVEELPAEEEEEEEEAANDVSRSATFAATLAANADDEEGAAIIEEKSRGLEIVAENGIGREDQPPNEDVGEREESENKHASLLQSAAGETQGDGVGGESAAVEEKGGRNSDKGQHSTDDAAVPHVNGHGKVATDNQDLPVVETSTTESRQMLQVGGNKEKLSETDTVKQMIEFLSSGGHDSGISMATPEDYDMVIDDEDEEEKINSTSRGLLEPQNNGVKKVYDGNISQGAFAPTDEDQERELNKLAEELLPRVSEIMAELDTGRSMSFGSEGDPSPLTPVRRSVQVDARALGAILEQKGLGRDDQPLGSLEVQPSVEEDDDIGNNLEHPTDKVSQLRMSLFEKDAELAALRASLEDVEDRDDWVRKKQTEKLATQHRELEKLSTQIEERNLEILTLERRLEEAVNFSEQRKGEWDLERDSLNRTIQDLTQIAQSKQGGNVAFHTTKDDEIRRLTVQLQEAKARTIEITEKWDADKRSLQSAAEKANQLENAHKFQETSLRRDLHNAELKAARMDSISEASKVKEETIANLTNEVMAATSKTRSFQAKLEAKEAEVDRLTAQLKLAEDSARNIQTMKSSVAYKEDEAIRLTTELNKNMIAQEKVDMLTRDVKDKNAEIALLTAEVDRLKKAAEQVKRLAMEGSAKDEDVTRLNDEHDAMDADQELEMETMQSTLDEHKDEIDRLQQELVETSERAEKVKSLEDELERSTEEARIFKTKTSEAETEAARLRYEHSIAVERAMELFTMTLELKKERERTSSLTREIEVERGRTASAEAGREKAENDAAMRLDELERLRDHQLSRPYGLENGYGNHKDYRGISFNEVSQEDVPPVPASLDDPYSLELAAYTLGPVMAQKKQEKEKIRGDYQYAQVNPENTIPLPSSFDDPFDLQLATVVLGKSKEEKSLESKESREKSSGTGREKKPKRTVETEPATKKARELPLDRSLPLPTVDALSFPTLDPLSGKAEDSSGLRIVLGMMGAEYYSPPKSSPRSRKHGIQSSLIRLSAKMSRRRARPAPTTFSMDPAVLMGNRGGFLDDPCCVGFGVSLLCSGWKPPKQMLPAQLQEKAQKSKEGKRQPLAQSGAMMKDAPERQPRGLKVAEERVLHADEKVSASVQKHIAKKRPTSEVKSSLVSPSEGRFAFSDESSGLSLILNVLSAGKQHLMKAQGYTYEPLSDTVEDGASQKIESKREISFNAATDECLPAIVASDDTCGVGISDDASGLRLVMQLIGEGVEKVKRKSTARKGVDSSSSASVAKQAKKKSEKLKGEKTSGEKQVKIEERVATREIALVDIATGTDKDTTTKEKKKAPVLAPDGSKGYVFGDDAGGVGLVLRLLSNEELQPLQVTVDGDDPSVAHFTDEPPPRQRVVGRVPSLSELGRFNGDVGTMDDGVGVHLVLKVLSKGSKLAPSSAADKVVGAVAPASVRGEEKAKKEDAAPEANPRALKESASSEYALTNRSDPDIIRDDPHNVGFVLDLFGAKGDYKSGSPGSTQRNVAPGKHARFHRVSLPKFVRLSERRSQATGEESSHSDNGATVLKHYLAHSGDDAATFKSAVASVVYDVAIETAPPSLEPEIPSLFQKPALILAKAGSRVNNEIAFGGNGIIKALAGMSNVKSKLTFSEHSLVDEWLEFERGELRTELSLVAASGKTNTTNTAKGVSETAVGKIDLALQSDVGRGRHVVGDHLTPADISIVSTLYCALRGDGRDPPENESSHVSPSVDLGKAGTCGIPERVVHYVQNHLETVPFQRGIELFETKLTNQASSKGSPSKGAFFLDDFATSRFALQLLQSRRNVDCRNAAAATVEFL